MCICPCETQHPVQGNQNRGTVRDETVMEIDEPEELAKFAHCGRLRQVMD